MGSKHTNRSAKGPKESLRQVHQFLLTMEREGIFGSQRGTMPRHPPSSVEYKRTRSLVSDEWQIRLSWLCSPTAPNSLPPLVGVLGGSRSDFPVLEQAVDILTRLGVPSELRVVSAHRTPDQLFTYAEQAQGRGIEVIIAGAGGAAHLPGMLAAKTHLPVIGVPIPTEHLRGLDSLFSIVQMPRGIPVATVAIGGAENAGLLAAQILAGRYPAIQKRILEFRREQTKVVLKTAAPAKRHA